MGATLVTSITTLIRPGHEAGTRTLDPTLRNLMLSPGSTLGSDSPRQWGRINAFRNAFIAGLESARDIVADDAADPPDISIWNKAIDALSPYAGDVSPPLVTLLQLGAVSIEWHDQGLNIEVRFREDRDPFVVIEDTRDECDRYYGRDRGLIRVRTALAVLSRRLD